MPKKVNTFSVHKVIMFSYFKTATTLLFAHVLKVVTAQKRNSAKSFWPAKGKQTLTNSQQTNFNLNTPKMSSFSPVSKCCASFCFPHNA